MVPPAGPPPSHVGRTTSRRRVRFVEPVSGPAPAARATRQCCGCIPGQLACPSNVRANAGRNGRPNRYGGERPWSSTNMSRRPCRTTRNGRASGTACSWKRGRPARRTASVWFPPLRRRGWSGYCSAGRPPKTSSISQQRRPASSPHQTIAVLKRATALYPPRLRQLGHRGSGKPARRA